MTDLARPRFGSINAAVATYSIGRSSIYELAREQETVAGKSMRWTPTIFATVLKRKSWT
jgi:hypothetical protein